GRWTAQACSRLAPTGASRRPPRGPTWSTPPPAASSPRCRSGRTRSSPSRSSPRAPCLSPPSPAACTTSRPDRSAPAGVAAHGPPRAWRGINRVAGGRSPGHPASRRLRLAGDLLGRRRAQPVGRADVYLFLCPARAWSDPRGQRGELNACRAPLKVRDASINISWGYCPVGSLVVTVATSSGRRVFGQPCRPVTRGWGVRTTVVSGGHGLRTSGGRAAPPARGLRTSGGRAAPPPRPAGATSPRSAPPSHGSARWKSGGTPLGAG